MVSDMTDIEKQIKEAAAILKNGAWWRIRRTRSTGWAPAMTDVNAVDRIFQGERSAERNGFGRFYLPI